MPRFGVALALALALLFALSSAAEEPPSYRIVLPSGEAHELLPKTCGVCHKDDPYRFFVVASPTQEGLDRALDALKGKGPGVVAALAAPDNPHAATACLFCHMEEPPAGAKSAAMAFRTLDGQPAAAGSVERLCLMCHPTAKESHPRVLGAADPAADLERAGLPLWAGKPTCATCHEMHGRDVGPADVRKDYLKFAARSPASFVHGNRTACRACHPKEPAPGEKPSFTDADPGLCTHCHSEDHGKIHPTGVAPTEKTFPLSFLNYPLDPQGRLSCTTCHDHVCRGRPDARNPRFLRGGPYYALTEFCYKCHPRAGIGALNPHKQVDENGSVIFSTCTFCHKTAPSQDAADLKELLYLRTPEELCSRCHDLGPHPTSINHLVEVPAAMLKKKEEYERRHKVTLPLHEERRITCTTCHNPHEKGVLRGEAALGAGELHQWRVPSYAELCTPCHARYD